MIWGYTKIPGYFFSSEFNYYQKTNNRVVAYINKQFGGKWEYKLQVYVRGFLGICDLEYRSSNLARIQYVADLWLEKYHDGEVKEMHRDFFSPHNANGYWAKYYQEEREREDLMDMGSGSLWLYGDVEGKRYLIENTADQIAAFFMQYHDNLDVKVKDIFEITMFETAANGEIMFCRDQDFMRENLLSVLVPMQAGEKETIPFTPVGG